MKGQVFTADLLGAVLLMTVILGFYLQAIQFTQNSVQTPQTFSPALLSQSLMNMQERIVLDNAMFTKTGMACISETDNAYCISLGPHLADSQTKTGPFVHYGASLSVILENGRPIGEGHSAHARIRQTGSGAYSDWFDHSANRYYLVMSTPDNSDPRTNGRRYELIFVNKPAFDPPQYCAQIYTSEKLVADGCLDVDLTACGKVTTATRVQNCGNEACFLRVNVCESALQFKSVS